MTNKERYKQAFSALQSSQKLSLEVEEMAEFQKKRKKNTQAGKRPYRFFYPDRTQNRKNGKRKKYKEKEGRTA